MDNKQHNADFLKRKAKKIKKEQNITHSVALDVVAKEYGYINWQNFIKTTK